MTLKNSEPEPDVTIVQGSRRDYKDHHPGPKDIHLIIEIADTSLAQDRDIKKPLYAQAQLQEYWIINLNDCQVEVFSKPVNNDYMEKKVFKPGDQIRIQIDNQDIGSVKVKDILP